MNIHKFAGAALFALIVIAGMTPAKGQESWSNNSYTYVSYLVSSPGLVTCPYSVSVASENNISQANANGISVVGPDGTTVASINFVFFPNTEMGEPQPGAVEVSDKFGTASTSGGNNTGTETQTWISAATFTAQGTSLTVSDGNSVIHSYTAGTTNANGPMSGTVPGVSSYTYTYNPSLQNNSFDVADDYQYSGSCAGTLTFYAPTAGYYSILYVGAANQGSNNLGMNADGQGGISVTPYVASYSSSANLTGPVSLTSSSNIPAGTLTATNDVGGAGGITLNWTITPPSGTNTGTSFLTPTSVPLVTPPNTVTQTNTAPPSGGSGNDGDGGGSSGGMTQ